MTPLPLEQIGLRGRHHRSALWWLGLLYGRPEPFRKAQQGLPRWQALRAGMILYLHVLPYALLLGVIGRFLVFGILGLELVKPAPPEESLLLFHAREIAWVITWGIAGGIAGQVFFWSMSHLKARFRSDYSPDEYARDEQPLRAELFSSAQMEQHGKILAGLHQVGSGRTPDQLLKRLKENERVRLAENERVLIRVHILLTEAVKANRLITPAGECLLDNFYLIEEHIRTANRHLPKGYSREMPRLVNGPCAGLPRVYDLAFETISHGDGRVNAESLSRFVAAYHTVMPLKVGELWAIPIMLRLALIENLRRVAARIAARRTDQNLADGWADQMTAMAENDPKNLILVIADMARSNPLMSSAFVAEMARRLQGQSSALALPLTWIEQRLAESGLTIEQAVQVENQQQAADQVSISNSIGSLRFLGAMDWREFFETMSVVDQALREDAGAVYGKMDFATPDRYRDAEEKIAKNSRLSEDEVARQAIHLTREGAAGKGIAGAIAVGSAIGSAVGIVIGIAVGIGGGIGGGIAAGAAIGIGGGIAGGIAIGITFGIAIGITFGIAIGITFGISSGISSGITFEIAVLRAYYHPFHLFFVWPTPQGRWYPWHPVAWDGLCSLPFPGLDRLLVAYVEYAPPAGRQEIERLIDQYPSQRMAALRAKARLIARASAQEVNLSRLDAHVARLPEGDLGFLAWTLKVRAMVNDICQLQMRLDTLNRPFLGEPTAALLVEKIKNFQSQVAGFPEPLASEFRQAANQWLAIAERQYRQVQAILTKEPTPAVFRAGDPVDRNKEAFIPREGVLGDLDRQLTLSTGCPGLILYGRRRMGKSTLLRNLEGFLPTSVQIAVVSMQNPDAFTSQADFLGEIARQAWRASQPERPFTAPTVATLKDFFQWLADCNARLAETNRRLLLAIDEYENLDRKLGEGVFDEDLLATLRESIQMHRQVTWVFAGSHAIPELTHAPWSSYLVSARTLEVPPFTEAETRRLLTEPLRHSSLWQADDLKRPRFNPDFWGDGGIERIHAEAGGWPHLVQLLAEKVVDLCNDREQAQVDRTLLEEAIAKAVVAGDTVLRQLMQPEDATPREWDYLRGFRARDTQLPPDDEPVYQALRRRLLVIEDHGEWRLRVPLMQRWLRERG